MRTVPPERWRKFMELRRLGHGITHAAKAAGLSTPTARAFVDELRYEQTTGQVSRRRSSGWAWLALRDAQRADEEAAHMEAASG